MNSNHLDAHDTERARALRALRAAGDRGLTDDELENRTVTDHVLDFLRAERDWHTLDAISRATILSPSQVNGVVYDLVGLGVVEMEHPARPRHHGEQRYRWRA